MKPESEPQKCKLNGYNLNYYREGSGETILFVHGITTYSFIWYDFIHALKDNYDVIAVDLVGCGESDKPLDVDYSIKNHALILKSFVDKLGIEKLHFVGHDLGGGIAQIFTVRFPENILTTTLINPVGYDFWPVQPIITMRTPIIRQFAMATLDLGMFKLIVQRGVYHKDRVNNELMHYFMMPMKEKAGRKAFLHFAACINNQNLLEIKEEICKIKTPVKIIRGDDDVYLSSSIAEKLHADIATSELDIVANSGHFIHFDESEKVIAIIKDFFSRNN